MITSTSNYFQARQHPVDGGHAARDEVALQLVLARRLHRSLDLADEPERIADELRHRRRMPHNRKRRHDGSTTVYNILVYEH